MRPPAFLLLLAAAALAAAGCASRPKARPQWGGRPAGTWHVRFDDGGNPVSTPADGRAYGRESAPAWGR